MKPSAAPGPSPIRPRTAAEGRIAILTRYFATDAVNHGDVASFPPPAALDELPFAERRRLLDGLLTIRPPRPIDDEDMRDELDDMLAAESRERAAAAGDPDALALSVLAATHGVPGALGERVALWEGDLTTLRAGAIVNAANERMLGCRAPGHACIDNVIHAVAGPGLRAECAEYMAGRAERGEGAEPVGRAVLTGGYHLPAEHVIHTVGPVVEGGVVEQRHRTRLASCYRAILDTAQGAGLDSVGLCSVSTGAFGYPKEEAAPLVLETIGAWLAARPESDLRIVICAFSATDRVAYESALVAEAGREGSGPADTG
ncbi:macro domain-containing protein [Actinomyces gaoshouyii]|nr:macro domain-containing protein [Actinomyces gaoshouyii]